MNFSPHAFSLRQLQYIVAVADLLSFIAPPMSVMCLNRR